MVSKLGSMEDAQRAAPWCGRGGLPVIGAVPQNIFNRQRVQKGSGGSSESPAWNQTRGMARGRCTVSVHPRYWDSMGQCRPPGLETDGSTLMGTVRAPWSV